MIKEEMDKLKKEQAKKNAWNYLEDLLEKAKEHDSTVTIETLRVRNNSAIPMMTIIVQAGRSKLLMDVIEKCGASMNHHEQFPFDCPTVKTTLFHQCVACGWYDCAAKLLEYDPGLTAVADSKDETPRMYLNGMLDWNEFNIDNTVEAIRRRPGESLEKHWDHLEERRERLLSMHECFTDAEKKVAKRKAEDDGAQNSKKAK